jgi:hypothetical protein
MRRALRAAALIVFVGLAQGAWAQEFLPEISVSSIYSDNPLRSHVSTGSAVVAEEDASLRILRNGTRLDIDGLLGVAEREFVSGGQGSELLPNANLEITGIIVPEHFTFTAQDSLGQISTQPFDVLSSNRQTVNYATAGPDARFQLDLRDSIALSGRYGQTTFQHSDLDNGRYSGEGVFTHLLGARTSVSAGYDYERIRYQHSELFPTIEKDVGFLRYTAQSARTYLVLEAGEELIKVSNGEATKKTPHASLALQRRVSPLMTFNAEFSHTFSDASEALQASVNDSFNVGGNHNVQATAAPYTSDGGYLMLLRTSPLTAAAIQVTFANQRYQREGIASIPNPAIGNTNALDRKLYGGDLVIDRRLSSRWTISAEARWSDNDYTGTDIRYTVLDTSLHLARMLGRSMQAGLVYEYARGGGNFDVYRFKENRVTLMITYAPGGVRSQVFDPVNQFRYYERPGRGTLPIQPQPPPGTPIDIDVPVTPNF